MSWVSVFAGFLVAHMVGDYLLQTDWQARHKRGGLTRPGRPARARHARRPRTRSRSCPPSCGSPASSTPAGPSSPRLLVFVPHLVVDDGRIVRVYLNRVKHVEGFDVGVASSVDQSFHVLSLWLVALLVGAA